MAPAGRDSSIQTPKSEKKNLLYKEMKKVLYNNETTSVGKVTVEEEGENKHFLLFVFRCKL